MGLYGEGEETRMGEEGKGSYGMERLRRRDYCDVKSKVKEIQGNIARLIVWKRERERGKNM